MRTRFLERDGGQIAYDGSGGTGPLVVCAPGMGDRRLVYRFLAPRPAAPGHRVVTTDLRGHGQSSTGWPDHRPAAVGEDLLALVRRLDAGPAVLVGLSFTPASAADGTVVMVDGAGHYPPAEFPEQTAAAMLPFLARVRAPGSAA
jgi:pimeloyl-ACP methyl ester carboxylesterase